MAGVKFVSILVLCMVVAPMAAQALTCGQVIGFLGPCRHYLKGQGGGVPAACCNGVRNIKKAAGTTSERQAACRCLKSKAKLMPLIKLDLAARLPVACNVSVPYKISFSTDCNKVK